MYRSINSPAFERDVKKCMKKHWDMGSFKAAISAILHSDEEPIPLKYNDHALSDNLQGKRELHVKGRTSDWLIMYEIVDGVVGFARTGGHDDLF